MSHITYTASIQTMGDASSELADRYVSMLQGVLSGMFPDATVRVLRDDRQSSSSVIHSTDIDIEEVNIIANMIWGSDRRLTNTCPPGRTT